MLPSPAAAHRSIASATNVAVADSGEGCCVATAHVVVHAITHGCTVSHAGVYWRYTEKGCGKGGWKVSVGGRDTGCRHGGCRPRPSVPLVMSDGRWWHSEIMES